MTVDTRDLTGVRASTAVRCPRAAVYQHQDAPRRPHTDRELRYFKRGQGWHDVVLGDVVDAFQAQGRRPRREELVPWPADDPVGVGHADLFIPSERLIVEVVSNAGGTLPEEKVLQAGLYALNHRNADRAVVLAVDTHTGDEHTYPINLDGIAPKVREIEDQVVTGCRTGTLPTRVCRSPLDGPALMCPFAEHCFQDWEMPPLEELLTDTFDLVKLAEAEDEVGAKRKALKDAEKTRDEIRGKLRPLIPANTESLSGAVTVRRTTFERESFSLADARKAGHDLPVELDPFVKTSQQERWTVKRLEEL